MIFLSAGHHLKDPGAVANGVQENQLTMELRDLIAKELHKLNVPYTLDKDTETLQEWLEQIKTDTGSVVFEVHFNSASPTATGIEIIVADQATTDSKNFANELVIAGSGILDLANRGVIPENKSARRRLGIMREAGIVALAEVCFISNKTDLSKYQAGKVALAAVWAVILKKYEDLRK